LPYIASKKTAIGRRENEANNRLNPTGNRLCGFWQWWLLRRVSRSVIFKKEKLMIKNKDIARNLSKLMLDIASRLNDSLYEVQEKCSEEEFKNYRRKVGSLMGTVATEVLNPLYREHPRH
jgi:hypothetical protein